MVWQNDGQRSVALAVCVGIVDMRVVDPTSTMGVYLCETHEAESSEVLARLLHCQCAHGEVARAGNCIGDSYGRRH